LESPKGFFCLNKACQFGLFKENRFFAAKRKELTDEIVRTMLAEGHVVIWDLYSEKTGKTYTAAISIDDQGSGYPGFKMKFADR
jgi:DNA topoisomerase-3